MTKNVISFSNGFITTKNINVDNRLFVSQVQSELMRFGYMLNKDAFKQLGYSDKSEIIEFHNEVISYLKEMTGSNRNYQPLYPGFPTQVLELSEYELWYNQFVHYWTNGKFDTVQIWTKEKQVAFEQPNYTIIKSGTEEMFDKIFTDLCSANQSLTPTDLDVIKWFVNSGRKLQFPKEIPFKENLCTLAGMEINVPVKTTTDVLRIALSMSGGDISLPAITKKNADKNKFKKFTNSEKRYILSLLENSNLDVREMKLKIERWIKLGEIIHPGNYSKQYPKSFKSFQQLRNEKVVSWNGEVDKAFKTSFETGLNKLSERPGEFVRRLDYLIRTNKDKIQDIFNVLCKVSDKISNKVLFEVYTHFENRRVEQDRNIFIKGHRKSKQLISLEPLSENIINEIQSQIFETLKYKFSLSDKLGDCWIDEELKKIPLPTNMRSLNPSLKPIIRGQRMPINVNQKTIRAFVHWFNNGETPGGCDIDLGAWLVGTNIDFVGWNGDRNNRIALYSGDITDRHGACAEYIDLNVSELTKQGYKYVVMDARDFRASYHDNKAFSIYEQCVLGFEGRKHPEANTNFMPSMINNCTQIQSTAAGTLLCIIDLETREYIWLDIDSDSNVSSRDLSTVLNLIKMYSENPKLSVYDLLSWNVESRGRLVSKETATTHYLFEDFSTNYINIMKFMGI
jgi:hypothetical protein